MQQIFSYSRGKPKPGRPGSGAVKLSTKRRALILNGALGVLLLGGAGIAYSSLGVGGGASTADAAVRTVPVTRGTVSASVSASGTVASAKARSLNFGSSGTVEKVYVEVGDKVTAGQILARLDDASASESLDAAAAALDSADDDTSTAAAYAQYVTARNTYREAQRAVAGTVIKAPFAGTVTAVNGAAGDSSGSSGSSAKASGSAVPEARVAPVVRAAPVAPAVRQAAPPVSSNSPTPRSSSSSATSPSPTSPGSRSARPPRSGSTR